MSEDITLFNEVDRTGDPDFFIRFLDRADADPYIQKIKPIILDSLQLHEGAAVLDLGCGSGADVVDIARRVGSSGAVTGVDASEAMIAEARRRTAGERLPVSFEVGNAIAQNRFAKVRSTAAGARLLFPSPTLRAFPRWSAPPDAAAELPSSISTLTPSSSIARSARRRGGSCRRSATRCRAAGLAVSCAAFSSTGG